MNKSYFNNDGLTLIELLASIAILGIVIIYFLSFFTQSIMFSSKLEDKLTALNVAEKVLSNVKNNQANLDAPVNLNGKYYYPNITYPLPSNEENKLKLIRVNIKIYMKQNYDPNSQPLTEIFGYVKAGG
ncbi:type IV pilus modification PilV family protein [Neobacillus soli]|uniref:type IV pilus modification PilV family protein n=1 Tax=Neobacillus soli TaxID=220688 RepID=UPI000825FE94|nr:type II secretion system protein [Neobacillus soli]